MFKKNYKTLIKLMHSNIILKIATKIKTKKQKIT